MGAHAIFELLYCARLRPAFLRNAELLEHRHDARALLGKDAALERLDSGPL
jgi:hypothetical protein